MKKIVSLCLIVCLLGSYIVLAEEAEKLPFVIEPQFESAFEFNKFGIAQVQLPTIGDEVGEVGVINLAGEKIFGFDGTRFVIRKNGLIMALGENDKAAFFSSEGKQLTDYVYETFKRVQSKTPHEVTYNYLTSRHDGDGESDLVPICREGKFGFINSRGEEAIVPTFDYVFGFYEGISKIGYDGNLSEYGTYTECMYGYINEKGEVLPTGKLWEASDFSYGYARIADGQYKVIDKSGNEVHFPTGDFEFLETNGHFILAGHDGGHIVLDLNGNRLSDWAPNIQLFGKSFIIGQKQIADKNGNIVYTAPEDVRINFSRKDSPVTEIYKYTVQNRISVQVDGLVNQDGKVVIEPKYKGLREVAEGIFWTPCADSLFDVNGNRIAEIDRYSVSAFSGYNTLSYQLLPVQSAENYKWGYVELPVTDNSRISKYTASDIYQVYSIMDTDYGTVLYLQVVGAPHKTGPFLLLIRKNGEGITLSSEVSRETIWAYPEHRDIQVSADGRYITFYVTFDERSAGSIADGEAFVLHDAGTYYYKADLDKGTCIETKFEPLDSISEEVISSWAKPEVESAIQLGFVPLGLRENYKRNITRAEFAKLAMFFLSVQYGYPGVPEIQFWSPTEENDNSFFPREFMNAYCYSKTDRNGNPFQDRYDEESYIYSNNKEITLPEVSFEDVLDSPHLPFIERAYHIGIVNGMSDSEFEPDGDITRQEAAAMLMRAYKNYANISGQENGFTFADDDSISHWAKEDVYAINALGIMQGIGENVFAPLDGYTVEQAIITFWRLYNSAPVSRKNKNITPLLDHNFELENYFTRATGTSYFSEKSKTEYEEFTVVYGQWSKRHTTALTSALYVFDKNGGVPFVKTASEEIEWEISPDEKTLTCYSLYDDTFRMYNSLNGTQKVYNKGKYKSDYDLESSKLVNFERVE